MSHSTVAHKWFHQLGNKRTKQNAFESGNMFYSNRIIYSYGKHFALAIRFDNLVLMNSKGYSNSTSKHENHTWYSIDRNTHEIFRVPFKEAYGFDDKVSLKDVYKYIDFKYYVDGFEFNLKKLGNARKPELYLKNIEDIQNKLNEIFTMFRGAKTLALKTKGLRKILNFEFTEETKAKLKKARQIELDKQKKKRVMVHHFSFFKSNKQKNKKILKKQRSF